MTTTPVATEIHLDVHVCDQRRSYRVTFPATPKGERMALDFMAARRSTHAISEVVLFDERWVCAPHGGDEFYRQDEPAADQPYLIDGDRFPALYAALHPTCHHGLRADLCMDPVGDNHFGTRDQELTWGF
jgi:hypothetical protein